jgi:DNA-binding CsgD family transcriptional regulator/tetratricopeptide (TPR) repeat protein
LLSGCRGLDSITVVGENGLVGRQEELGELRRFLGTTAGGSGGLLLVAGEAGVGKTALVEHALADGPAAVLHGAGSEEATAPYGPVVETLRAHLRRVPDALSGAGSLSAYLGVLLPELGSPPGEADRATLFEAIRWAFAAIAADGPAAVVLDDLHWADETTLALLPTLAASVEEAPLALIGIYRSDEVHRGHQLRRARTELRRAGRLGELEVEPLGDTPTASLCERLLGGPISASLGQVVFDRTQGVPFFIEELVATLEEEGALREGRGGIELAKGEEMPIPDSVRDAVLFRFAGLDATTRRGLEVAAAIGTRFSYELVAALDPNPELDEAIARGLLVERGPSEAAFRHALAREAIYGELSWSRRRELHRQIAEWLEARRAPVARIAEHWLAARELERARPALVAAASASCAVHAYKDAYRSGRRALEIWPNGSDETARLAMLERLGECAELSGDVADAIRAWREVAESHRSAGDSLALARIQGRLAAVFERECQWDAALAARQEATTAFVTGGEPGEAAAERLAAAGHVQAAGRLRAALELIAAAKAEADESGRTDLAARALGLEGQVLARSGRGEEALEAARAGLSLSLAEEQTAAAAECYDRLGMVLAESADYAKALDAFAEAAEFCETTGEAARRQGCLACVAWLTVKTGEWERSIEVSRGLLDDPEAPRSAHLWARWGLGTIDVLRGNTKRGRRVLESALADAERTASRDAVLELTTVLARADEDDGSREAALAGCRRILELSRGSEDRDEAAPSNAAPSVRWAASLFAAAGERDGVGACAAFLAHTAAPSSHRDSLAALSHALGELALLDNDPEAAARHFTQALEPLRELGVPLDRAETQLRAGVALAAAGERELAVERLVDTYRTARKLHAKPLARRAAEELQAMGEPVEKRLGRRAATLVERGGLSRRELEVMRLVSVGRTNREIARELFLSPRTVDMHVRNILMKLGCRSRTEATRRAAELGVIELTPPSAR